MNVVFSSVRKIGAMGTFFVILPCMQSLALAADQTVPSLPASGFSSMLQVLFGLGLVLAAIAGTAWLLKRFAPGQVAASGAIRVVGGVAVGPKERVVLVDVGETRLVLGVAPGHISTLLEMPRPVVEDDAHLTEGDTGEFYMRLKKIVQMRTKDGRDSAR